MSKIKYHFALNDKGEVIDIANVTESDRQSKFYCLNCGDEMRPRLGAKNAHHFAHKNTTPDCNPETYLHKLAKRKIKEKFDSAVPFEISFFQTSVCSDKNSCPFYKKEECKSEEYKSYDLHKTYDTCTEEQIFGNYRADLLLTSSTKPDIPPVFIEILVTHKCEEEKIKSDHKIIEIEIRKEEDIIHLTQSPIIEPDKYSFDKPAIKCTFYNFKRTAPVSKLEMRGIPKFYLFKSGSAYVSNMDEYPSCREVMKKDNPKAVLELVVDALYFDNPSIHELGYAKAYEMGYNVRNCLLCEYHKGLMPTPNVNCPYERYGTTQDPIGPEAMNCSYYRINHENDDQLKTALATTSIIVCK